MPPEMEPARFSELPNMPRALPRFFAEPFSESTPQAQVASAVPRRLAVWVAVLGLIVAALLVVGGALLLAGLLEEGRRTGLGLASVLGGAAFGLVALRSRRHLVISSTGITVVNMLRRVELRWEEVERVEKSRWPGRIDFVKPDGRVVRSSAAVDAGWPAPERLAQRLNALRRHVERTGNLSVPPNELRLGREGEFRRAFPPEAAERREPVAMGETRRGRD